MRRVTLSLVLFLAYAPFGLAQANLGTVAVGSSSTATATVAFLYPGTLAAITGTTGGKQNLDFTASEGSCKLNTYHAANDLCTVTITFAPTLAGPRYGSVVLTNSTGTPLGELFVTGTGQAPQTSFSPAPQIQLLGNAASYFAPNGLAADSAGNAYAIIGSFQESIGGGEPVPGSVFRIPGDVNANGFESEYPSDLTVDGAGNTYINDITTGVSVLFPSGSYSWSHIPTSSFGLADANGNLYKSCSTGLCKESLVFGGTYTESTISSITPHLLFVDGAGDVFAVTESGYTETIYKFTPSGDSYTQTTVASGLSGTENMYPVNALAADPLGNVYFIDSSNNVYKEALQQDGSYSQSLLFSGAVAQYLIHWADHYQQSDGANRLAVDPAGNIYFWKQTGTVTDTSPNPTIPSTQVPVYGLFEAEYSHPSALTFPQTLQHTTSAAQTVTITNSGNLPLLFSAITSPADFKATPTTTNGCTADTTLTPGESCSLNIVFNPITPVSSGASAALSETITVTTNTGNAPGTQQGITVTGIEQARTAQPTFSLPAGTYNTNQTVTLSDATPGAVIHYSLNGIPPTASSSIATGPITIKASATLQAIAVAPNLPPSPIASASYTLVAPTPVITITGTPGTPQLVTISTPSPIQAIFYTTAGNLPTTSSAHYTGPFTVPVGTRIYAMAAQTGFTSSPAVSAKVQ